MPAMRKDIRVSQNSKRCNYCNHKLGENVTNEMLITHLIEDCEEVGKETRQLLKLQCKR